jgi:hypothetical protein
MYNVYLIHAQFTIPARISHSNMIRSMYLLLRGGTPRTPLPSYKFHKHCVHVTLLIAFDTCTGATITVINFL